MHSIQILLVILVASSAVAYFKGKGSCPSPNPEMSFGTDIVTVMSQLQSIGPMHLMFRDGYDIEQTTSCIALQFNNLSASYDYSAYYGDTYMEVNAGTVIASPENDNPLNIKVELMEIPKYVFNTNDEDTAKLHFFYQDDLIVMARSCRLKYFYYLESYYVFVKTNAVPFQSISSDCIKTLAQTIVTREFYHTGYCGNAP